MFAAQAAEAALDHSEQLDFFANPESWVAITWLVVVLLLARPAGKAIIQGLDRRRDRIQETLAEAERLRDEAQEALATYQKKQREALKDAEDIIAQARAEAARLTQQAAESLTDLVRRREQQALDRVAQSEADAIRDVRNRAVEIAVAAAGAVIADHLPAEKAAALIDTAIKDLPGQFH